MPKWTQVKRHEEIAKVLSKQLSLPITILTPNAINTPGTRPSPLAQELIGDFSDDKFAQKSANKDNADKFDNPVTSELFGLFYTDFEANSQTQKSKKQTSKTDTQKRQHFPFKIFNYIPTAKCCRLFSLAWYNDQTYGSTTPNNTVQPLFTLCCNRPGCQ